MTKKDSQRNGAGGRPTVLLVAPPFHGMNCPSLGASTLKANLERHGIPSEILYLNLRFAERIGPRPYEWLSGTGKNLTGELIFSHVLYERDEGDVDRYVDEVLGDGDFGKGFAQLFPGRTLAQSLRDLIREARDFVRGEAVEAILEREPSMIGLSSIFESVCPSIAVIQEVARRRPEIVTVMGGPNCEGSMGEEIFARFPFIDFVGRGECDEALPELVRNLEAGRDGCGVLGFLARGADVPTPAAGPLNGDDLDALANPDYVDYFRTLEGVSFREHVHPGLAMETSRGCWWGWKQHCTFCAFNRNGMIFRSKSPDRVVEEVRGQIASYGIDRVELTDNILDMEYFKSVLPRLAENGRPAGSFFWETKSNLTKEHVGLLHDAGVRWIQPGLESLSDLTLKLMKKGTSQLQNAQTLKWCTERGIKVTWNWLFGFPGEDEAELDGLERTVRSLHHLQPPGAVPVLYLERFSPYFEQSEEWNLEGIVPTKAYRHIHPFEPDVLHRLAFFFDCEHLDAKERSPAYARLKRIVDEWRARHGRSHLLAVPRRRALFVLDTRAYAVRRVHRLTGLRRRIYEHCDQVRGVKKIVRDFVGEVAADEVIDVLRSLVDDRLVLENEDRYLALATDPRLAYKEYPRFFPGGHFVVPREKKDEGARRRQFLAAVALRVPPPVVVRGLRRRVRDVAVRSIVGLSKRLALEPAAVPAGGSVGAPSAPGPVTDHEEVRRP